MPPPPPPNATAQPLSIAQKIAAIEETEETSGVMFYLMTSTRQYMTTLADAYAGFVQEREALLQSFWKPIQVRVAIRGAMHEQPLRP